MLKMGYFYYGNIAIKLMYSNLIIIILMAAASHNINDEKVNYFSTGRLRL